MPEEANGSVVRVTLKDVYETVRRIEADVAELNATIPRVADHEVRIRGLERWKNAVPAAVVIALGAAAAAFIRAFS